MGGWYASPAPIISTLIGSGSSPGLMTWLGGVTGLSGCAVAGTAAGAAGAVMGIAKCAAVAVGAVGAGPFLRLAAVAAGCVAGWPALVLVVGGLGKPGAGLAAPSRRILASTVATTADFAPIAPQRKWVRGRGKLVDCCPGKDGLINIGCSRFSPFAQKRASRPLLLFFKLT